MYWIRGVLISVFALSVLSPVDAQPDPDYTLRISDGVGGFGGTVAVTVALDFSGGDPVSGYQWGVCHDDEILAIEEDDVVNDNGIEDVSFTFQALSDFDDAGAAGWTVGSLLNVITGDTLTPAEDVEMFVASYVVVGVASPGAELEWCETLGSPEVTVRMIVSSEEIEPVSIDGFIVIDETVPVFSIEDGVGELGCSAEISVLLSNAVGSAIEGYEFGVCHDEVVALTEGDVSIGSGLADLEFDFESLSVVDGGWTVSAIFARDVSVVIDSGESLELYVVTYDIIEDDRADIEFCGTLDDSLSEVPSIVVDGSNVDGFGRDGVIDGTETVDPTFIFRVSDVDANYRPVTGIGDLTVTVSVEQVLTGPEFTCLMGTQAVSLSLSHDDDLLSPTAADLHLDLDDLVPDDDAFFMSVDVAPSGGPGVTVGIVYFFASGTLVEFPTAIGVVDVHYSLEPSSFLDRDDDVSTLISWTDGIGDPPVDNAVVTSPERNAILTFIGSVVTLSPDLSPNFLRGDADGNGVTFPIVDALFVLEWGFLDGPQPDCLDAADFDGNDFVFPIIDALFILQYQFISGEVPPDPGPFECGEDNNDDNLGCETQADVCL